MGVTHPATLVVVLAGRCDRCGFEPDKWTDAAAIRELDTMSERWPPVVTGVAEVDLGRRLVRDTWSIAEYVDHVRETMFVMRFLLEVAGDGPEVDLGAIGEPTFDAEPRRIDSSQAMQALWDEVHQLCARLDEVAAALWDASVVLGGRRVDVHWIVRNALHECSHHLGDVSRLREIALTEPAP